jgi:hypothetical protein
MVDVISSMNGVSTRNRRDGFHFSKVRFGFCSAPLSFFGSNYFFFTGCILLPSQLFPLDSLTIRLRNSLTLLMLFFRHALDDSKWLAIDR